MTKSELRKLIRKYENKIKKAKILCIGDIILDKYIHGKINRMSPEAPVPIFLAEEESFQIGGVGNVAKNISRLGGKVTLIYLNGKDSSSKIINNLLLKEKKIKTEKINSQKFQTPLKIRITSKSKQIIRIDKEISNFKLKTIEEKKILDKVKKNIKNHDIVLISDYSKGLFSKNIIKKINIIAKKNNKIILADPKNIDLSYYSNLDAITPNEKEITDSFGVKSMTQGELIDYALELIKKYKIKNILITRSEKGMLLINTQYNKKIKSIATQVNDVTGAGDTVIAVFALMLSMRIDEFNSALISNYAAGLVIKKIGPEAISFEELID